MCGISGIISNNLSDKNLEYFIDKMGRILKHRGPDQYGKFIHKNIALSHNRLSIIDIEGGAQPMLDEDKENVIIYNGEIYNNASLKALLQRQGFKFKSDHSDTETILLLFKKYRTKSFSMLEGMFAFSIFSKKDNKIYIVRDEIGIKPLYYCYSNNNFIFSSEIKAILNSNQILPKLNSKYLPDFFFNRSTINDNTLFFGIKKLLPGRFLEINTETLYFKCLKFSNNIKSKNFRKDFNSKNFDSVLKNEVFKHMESDVPIGIALSGGIDSSLLTHYASLYKRRISTFSIGSDSIFDESKWSNYIAKKYSTKHHLINISSEDLIESFDKWMNFNDDPIGDPSALAFFKLCEVVSKKGIKVLLCGEGADEVFGGYNSYIIWLIYKKIKNLPLGITILKLINLILKNKRLDDYLFMQINIGFSCFLGTTHNISLKDLNRLFRNKLFKNKFNPKEILSNFDLYKQYPPAAENILIYDQSIRLHNDLLTRADKASMAYGLETRVPFLSKNIYKITRSLNLNSHLSIFPFLKTKKILKNISKSLFGIRFTYRKKNGFQLPCNKWINNELKDKCEFYTRKQYLQEYINYEFIVECLNKKNNNANTALIWNWLIIEVWHEKWIINYESTMNILN